MVDVVMKIVDSIVEFRDYLQWGGVVEERGTGNFAGSIVPWFLPDLKLSVRCHPW